MIVLVLLHFHISQQCLTLYRTKFHMCCCCWSSFKWYSSPSVNWGLGTIYKHQRLNYHIRISSNLSFIYFFFFSWPILGCCEYNNSGRVYNTLHLVISSWIDHIYCWYGYVRTYIIEFNIMPLLIIIIWWWPNYIKTFVSYLTSLHILLLTCCDCVSLILIYIHPLLRWLSYLFIFYFLNGTARSEAHHADRGTSLSLLARTYTFKWFFLSFDSFVLLLLLLLLLLLVARPCIDEEEEDRDCCNKNL